MLTCHWYWSLKLCKPTYDEWVRGCWMPVATAFATGRPICMQLVCWWHCGALDAAVVHRVTEWRREQTWLCIIQQDDGGCRQGSRRNPTAVWLMGKLQQWTTYHFSSSVKCNHVEVKWSSSTWIMPEPIFQEFILIYHSDMFRCDNM